MLSKKSKIGPLSIFLFFTIVPLVVGLVYALLYSLGIVGALSNGFTLAHWQAVFSSTIFINSLCVSVLIASISLIISIIIALFLTISIENNPKLKTQNSTSQNSKPETQNSKHLFYLPLSIPPIIAAFLTFQFLSNSGIVSRVLNKIGFIENAESFPELVNDALYIGVIVTQVFMTFPFLTLLFLNFHKTFKINELSQLSQTLGATNRQIQRCITIPILLQKARPNIVLLFIVLMSSYEIPLLLGRQSPMMLSVLIGQKFRKFNLLDIPQAYVMTVIYAVLVMGLVALFFTKKEENA